MNFLRMFRRHFRSDNLPKSAKFLVLTGKSCKPKSVNVEATHWPRIFICLPRSLYRIDAYLAKDGRLTRQLALFPPEKTSPQGLGVAEEFISPALERELIGHVTALPLQPFQFGAFEGKRRVASFGFRYDYTLQRLQPADRFPTGFFR